jgi:hypothetical protein
VLIWKKAFLKMPAYLDLARRQLGSLQGWRDYVSLKPAKLLMLVFTLWYQDKQSTINLAVFMPISVIAQVFPLQMYWITMRGAPSTDTKHVDWSVIFQQLFMVNTILQVTGVFLALAWCLPRTHRDYRAYSVLACMCTPFLLTFFGGNPSFFPANVAYLLKFGNFATTEITLTAAGCQAIAGKTVAACERTAEGGNKIYGAYVMSRIGTEVYLRIRSLNGNAVEPIYLDAKDLTGIKIDESKRFYNKQSIEKFLLAPAKHPVG